MMKKNTIDDLAIFNGTPAFSQTLHVGQPNIGNRKKLFKRLNDLLERDWLTNNGPYVCDFEQRIASRLNVKHCIAMCNGTIALEIAARALGLKGEVIIPSYTFIATAHSLQWQKISPVFCDIDPRTHTIDPEKIESLITPRTTGIMGVHLWGRPCNVESLEKIARKNNLRLLFDAAHAFGCSHTGKMIGGFGDAEIVSFHATKFINSFEGGAVLTNDDNLAEKMRLMRNFGFAGLDNVIYIGTNGKMNEAAAAMGLTSLESFDAFLEVNHRNYHLYRKYVRDIPGISMMAYNETEKNNYQYIVLEIDENKIIINRDLLIQILHAENIRARRYFYPCCHRMEPYISKYPNASRQLPETEKIADRIICLPTGMAVGPGDIEKIAAVLQLSCNAGADISKRLSTSKHKNLS